MSVVGRSARALCARHGMPGQTPRFTSWVAFEMHCVGIDASVRPCLYAARRLCPPTVAVHECAVIAKAQVIVCPTTRAGILFDSWFQLFAIIWEIPGARLPPGIDTAPFWNRFGLGLGTGRKGAVGFGSAPVFLFTGTMCSHRFSACSSRAVSGFLLSLAQQRLRLASKTVSSSHELPFVRVVCNTL